jgi:thiol:disulfide interchange protein DsbD
VNKRIALGNEQVVREFSARCVVPLKADWTRRDPRITEALSAMGRNAVPVYALYVPGQDEPRLLPEVLTPSLVLDELARLPGCSVAPARPAATTLTRR